MQSSAGGYGKRWIGLLQGSGLRAQLIRGGLGTAGIQAANRILALALGIVLARTLGAEGYGIYAYAFAIMSLLIVLAEAGVPTLLMREVATSQGREQWGRLRGVLRLAGLFVGVVAASVSVMGLVLLWWWADTVSLSVLYTTGLMLLLLPVSALSKTVAHSLLGLRRVVIGQAIDLLIRPLLVLVLVMAVFVTWPDLRDPQYAMAAQFLGAAAVLIIGIVTLRRLLPVQLKTAAPEYPIREWLNSVLPFTLIGGAGVINSQVDIIMLGWYSSADDVGIYRVATQGAGLVVLPLYIANAVAAPHFARFHAHADMARLQRLVTLSARVALFAALPVTLTIIVAGNAIVGWAFGTAFAAAYGPMAILSIGWLVIVGLGPVGSLLNMLGHERVVSRILWQTAVLNVVMNGALIPLFGIDGAAVATSVSLVLMHGLLCRHMRNRLGLIPTAFAAQSQ